MSATEHNIFDRINRQEVRRQFHAAHILLFGTVHPDMYAEPALAAAPEAATAPMVVFAPAFLDGKVGGQGVPIPVTVCGTPFLSMAAAADAMGVHTATVQRALRQGVAPNGCEVLPLPGVKGRRRVNQERKAMKRLLVAAQRTGHPPLTEAEVHNWVDTGDRTRRLAYMLSKAHYETRAQWSPLGYYTVSAFDGMPGVQALLLWMRSTPQEVSLLPPHERAAFMRALGRPIVGDEAVMAALDWPAPATKGDAA